MTKYNVWITKGIYCNIQWECCMTKWNICIIKEKCCMTIYCKMCCMIKRNMFDLLQISRYRKDWGLYKLLFHRLLNWIYYISFFFRGNLTFSVHTYFSSSPSVKFSDNNVFEEIFSFLDINPLVITRRPNEELLSKTKS